MGLLSRPVLFTASVLLVAATAVLPTDAAAGTFRQAAPAAAAPSEPGDGFTAISPVRVLDTRSGTGTDGKIAPIGAGATLVLDLSASVPSTATAVVLNLTGTNATTGTFVEAWPDGTDRPVVGSNLNLVAGETAPNLVTVTLGSGSKVDLYNKNGSVDLIADLEGYYSPNSSIGLTSLNPTRVLDTRNGTGTGGKVAPVGAGATLVLDLSASVPSTATAVVLNLTGTNATTGTFVEAWPDGTTKPTAGSNLNLVAGQTAPNLVIVALGADGKIDLYNKNGSVDLIADLEGYYSPGSASTFSSIITSRELDTRNGTGIGGTAVPVGPAGSIVLDLSNVLPPTATAVVLNLTGTNASTGTFVEAWPDGTTRPTAGSNLNLVAGQTAPNLVTVALGAGDKIDLYNKNGSVDLIADVSGYFAPTFSCTSGCAYSWGYDTSGSLGNRSYANSTVPVSVFGLNGITSLATSGQYGVGFAARSDGTVWAWGMDSFGTLGNGASCVNPNPLPGWDCNSNVPVRSLGLTSITAVSGDVYRGFALRSDGTVWHIGPYGTLSTPSQVPGLTGITALAGGLTTDYALKSDGTVWAWGTNLNGEFGNGTTSSSGDEGPVQVSGLTGVTAISADPGDRDGEALKSDGTVWVWGGNALDFNTGNPTSGASLVPVQVSGLVGVTAISDSHALKSDGTVWSWGQGPDGELGNGTHSTTVQAVPVQVTGLTGVVALAQGFPGAVKSDGTAWSWGSNLFGQLGNGTTGGESDVPVQISGLTGVSALAGGGSQSFALVPGSSS